MINYEEAFNLILDELKDIDVAIEEVSIRNAVGRILMEDIISDIDLPPFDNSAVDGYAFKYEPNINNFKIISEISAGHYQDYNVENGDCSSIMTGAKLPKGADTVIPIEDVEICNNQVLINNDVRLYKGMNVRYCGEDIKKGAIVIKQGTEIKTNHIQLIASCGYSTLKVKKKLKIGVFSSGDELVSIDTIPDNDKIRASNLESIITLINNSGYEVLDLGIISDSLNDIRNKLIESLNYNIDVLITTGGVSVGKFDFMKEAIQDIGANVIFWKANIKPGKPILFSVYNKDQKKIPIFSLPGNPLSSFVNFKIFIERSLNIISNKKDNYVKAKLVNKITKKDNKMHFVLGQLDFDYSNNYYTVLKAGSQSSGRVGVLANSNSLIIFPETDLIINEGEFVRCIKI